MGTRRTGALVAVVALLVLLGIAGSVGAHPPAAQPPEDSEVAVGSTMSLMLNYQGRLLDPSTGDPKPDGTYPMSFSVHDVSTGGTALWIETKYVEVEGGLFSTALGDTQALPASLFTGQDLWLAIQVGADLPASPRQQLLPVPYTIHAGDAGTVDGMEGADLEESAEIDADVSAHAAITEAHHARYTDGEALTAVLDNDGTGSGLDADLWDGLDSSTFGDITAVAAGTGLSGGGTTGAVMLSADTTYVQRRVVGTCGSGSAIRVISADGTVTCEPDDDTTYTAGTGLSLTDSTFNVNFAGGGAATTAARSDHDHSGADITSGTLSNDRFSAYGDLSAEGYLGNASGDLAQNNGVLQTSLNADLVDGQHASAFATTGHGHWGEMWEGEGTGLRLLEGATGLEAFGHEYGVHASSGEGIGVLGLSEAGDGLFGRSGLGPGVHGESDSAMGVFGHSMTDSGVYGESVDGHGGYFASTNSYGVQAETGSVSPGQAGVLGVAGWTALTPAQEVGVFGKSSDGMGVAGMSDNQTGVYGYSSNSYGVRGETVGSAAAVFGGNWADGSGGYFYSANHHGVYGDGGSGTGDYSGYFSGGWGGVYAKASATSGTAYGVYGEIRNHWGYGGYFTNTRGTGVFGGHSDPSYTSPAVYGQNTGSGVGVLGDAYGSSAGVYGRNYGTGCGVEGYSANSNAVYATGTGTGEGGATILAENTGDGVALWGKGKWGLVANATGDGTYAGYFYDDIYVMGKIDVIGTVDPIIGERFEVDPSGEYEVGDLLVIDPDSRYLKLSTEANDTKVIGVVGPGVDFRDGELMVIVMGYHGAKPDAGLDASQELPERTVVKIKVDASYGIIKRGDLLTTSPTPGHAMKAQPVDVGGVAIHRPGTIVGKALESIESGQDLIDVFIALQ